MDIETVAKLLALLFGGAAILFNVLGRSDARRTSGRDRPVFRLNHLLPDLGTRSDYSRRGWRYRNLMLGSMVAAVFCMLLWWQSMPLN